MNDARKTALFDLGALLAHVADYTPGTEGHSIATARGNAIAAAVAEVLGEEVPREGAAGDPHDSAFLSWARNDMENDVRRAEWLIRHDAIRTERERCAAVCESMIIVGRAWTEEQAAATNVLDAAARNIRAGVNVSAVEAPPVAHAERVMLCATCSTRTPHRFRPSPEAGSLWRCSDCGSPNEAPPNHGGHELPDDRLELIGLLADREATLKWTRERIAELKARPCCEHELPSVDAAALITGVRKALAARERFTAGASLTILEAALDALAALPGVLP